MEGGLAHGFPRSWCIVHAPCSMVNGQWSMGHGPWSIVHGPWSMVHGPRPMVNGPWSMAQGPWSMEVFWANSLASIGRDLRRDRAPDLGAILV